MGNSEAKRRILGSIYPRNIHFDDGQHRTALDNEFVRNIALINKRLRQKKD